MEIVRLILLFLHLVGFAALLGGAFVQLKGPKRTVNAGMLHGSITQLVTGLLLVGVLEMGDADVNHAKIAVKALLAVVIFVLILTQRKKENIQSGMFFAIFTASLVTAGVAVFW